MIVYLKCSNNNQASTVLELFTNAVSQFGLPSRVRSDFGMENYLVARHMLQSRGEGRNSMLTGSSTHNQRIERLWVDVKRSVTLMYSNLFYFMEDHDLLDPLNEVHIFALHYIFIPRINHSLLFFQNGWNHHAIRTANHQSPYQMFVQGSLHLHSSRLTAMDFFDTVDEFYGTEGVEVSTEESRAIVTVPETRIRLLNEQLLQLSNTVDPLEKSDNYGIDLYLAVLELLSDTQTQ